MTITQQHPANHETKWSQGLDDTNHGNSSSQHHICHHAQLVDLNVGPGHPRPTTQTPQNAWFCAHEHTLLVSCTMLCCFPGVSNTESVDIVTGNGTTKPEVPESTAWPRFRHPKKTDVFWGFGQVSSKVLKCITESASSASRDFETVSRWFPHCASCEAGRPVRVSRWFPHCASCEAGRPVRITAVFLAASPTVTSLLRSLFRLRNHAWICSNTAHVFRAQNVTSGGRPGSFLFGKVRRSGVVRSSSSFRQGKHLFPTEQHENHRCPGHEKPPF